MNLIVYPEDVINHVTIKNVGIKHIRLGMAFPQVSDVVIFVDVNSNQFKILKYRDANEYVNVIIDDIDEHITNFI